MSSRPSSSASAGPATQIQCPNLKCRKVLAVPAEARGQVVKCSHCQSLLRIPAHAPKPAKPEAA